tara:strand:+ start:818 stop:1051 length:234 start_codon:yes stop_codon:yes gene_type:complete
MEPSDAGIATKLVTTHALVLSRISAFVSVIWLLKKTLHCAKLTVMTVVLLAIVHRWNLTHANTLSERAATLTRVRPL